MQRSVAELLKDHLAPRDYEVLRRLSRGWHKPLFSFDPVRGAFECNLNRVSEEDLDAVLTACEVLSAHASEVDRTQIESLAPWKGELTLPFRFSVDEEELKRRFVSLLEPGARRGAWTVEERREHGEAIVRVAIACVGEHEFQARQQQVNWLYELARRQLAGQPFLGQRL